jgi:NAD(P)H-flavin reductase/ferredoxin
MSHEIRVAGSDIAFPCDPGETILDAAERAGYAVPYSCRKGVCATCEGTLARGAVDVRGVALRGPADHVRFCVAKPDGDIEIAPSSIERDALPARKTFDAVVNRIDRPAADVAILHLRLPIGRRVIFRAGQYARLLLPDGASRNYSMANPPQNNSAVELHVRKVPGGVFSDRTVAGLTEGATLTVELPYGRVALDESDCPIVMLATGTGFAPLKAMLEDLARRRLARPVHLFWGGSARTDLYHADLVERWSERWPWFRFTPLLSHPQDGWSGEIGFVQEAALAAYPDLSGFQVFACGNPRMVEDARAAMLARGNLPASAYHADAFVPSGDPAAAEMDEGT